MPKLKTKHQWLMLSRLDILKYLEKEDYPTSQLLLKPNSLVKLQKEELKLLVDFYYFKVILGGACVLTAWEEKMNSFFLYFLQREKK